MRRFAILLALFVCVPVVADDDWIGEVKPIVTPDPPGKNVLEELAELRSMVERLQKIIDTMKASFSAMPMPEVCECDCNCEQNTAAIASLGSRLARVEEQLSALVTVQKADGTQSTEAVEIDTVEGYGDFEVPVGGKVIAIDGVRIRDHYAVASSPIYNTPTYFAAPVEEQKRTVRIAPIRRAASVFAGRYYVDADGCTVDRVTGRKVSCPASR